MLEMNIQNEMCLIPEKINFRKTQALKISFLTVTFLSAC